MTTAPTNQNLGLFAHYRPVVLALPAGGCGAVAAFLGAESVDTLVIQLEAAGLLYRHQHWGAAVSQLLHAELDEPMLNGLPEQLFRWNPEAKVVVEPLRLVLNQGPEEESLELDVRFRSDHALLAGPSDRRPNSGTDPPPPGNRRRATKRSCKPGDSGSRAPSGNRPPPDAARWLAGFVPPTVLIQGFAERLLQSGSGVVRS